MRRPFAPTSLVAFPLLVLAALILAPVQGARALDREEVGAVAEEPNKAFEYNTEATRNLGGNALITDEATEKEPIEGAPPPVRANHEFKVPPMAGFQQIAGMKSMKDMLKRLITADVPVMYQTMMMVENGAATGFIGSMNTVGSLLSNTIQTSQLQMDLFDAIESGGNKKAYALEAYRELSGPGENKNSWPAALWAAGGDRVKGTPQPIEEVKDSESPTGSSMETIDKLEEREEATPTGPKKEFLLSKLVFRKSPRAPSDPDATKLRDGMLDWVGDLKIVAQQTSDHTSIAEPEYIKARKFTRTGSSGAGSSKKPSSVYDVLLKNTTLDIWKHMHEIMKQYCSFKQKNDNYSREIFEKERPSSAINDEDWKKIHSLDVKPSINLVDQLFKLFLGRRNVEEINCDSFRGTENTLPESGDATEASGTIFDSCDEKPKLCLRNIVLYRITKFIAVSQVNYFYRWLWERIYSRTKDLHEQEYLTDLFCMNVKLGWPCDPGTEFSTRIEMNRIAWIEFSNKLSRFAQGQGGSTIFRPSSDSSTIGAAGSVAMGSGSTGGEGGR